jgi:hypothetical protein
LNICFALKDIIRILIFILTVGLIYLLSSIQIEINQIDYRSAYFNVDLLKSLQGNLHCEITYKNLYLVHKNAGKNIPKSKLNTLAIKKYNNRNRFNQKLINSYFITDDFEKLNSLLKAKIESNISNNELEKIKNQIKNFTYCPYEKCLLKDVLETHVNLTKFKTHYRLAIVDLFQQVYTPWIESLVLYLIEKNDKFSIKNIDVVDYEWKTYENKLFKWISLSDYLSKKVNQHSSRNISRFDEYDLIINHYMLDKVGIGRYGESVILDADIFTMDQMGCMLKDDGLLILALSLNKHYIEDLNNTFIEYNIQRRYGTNRLNRLLRNWTPIYRKTFNMGSDEIFVLQKKRISFADQIDITYE